MITLRQARALVAAGEAQADALGVRVNIAVLDGSGHLKVFSRMDGAVCAATNRTVAYCLIQECCRAPTPPPSCQPGQRRRTVRRARFTERTSLAPALRLGRQHCDRPCFGSLGPSRLP